MAERLAARAREHLQRLCVEIGERPAGSPGNQASTAYLARVFADLGFDVATPRFEALHWVGGDVRLEVGSEVFSAQPSPYSAGCRVRAPLAVAATIEEVEGGDVSEQVLLLRGDLAREQLMPKGFTFYNPERHQRIVGALEVAQPAAVIAATGLDPSLAGGLSPFPLIEDGDVAIPSVYLSEAEGERLAQLVGEDVLLQSEAQRIPSWGCNVIATKGAGRLRRIVACAHVDAKLGTPGALDDAAGVAVLLLLAELLRDDPVDQESGLAVELVAMNGEDHYANPGELAYLAANEGRMGDIALAINLDGVGYVGGRDAFSTYECGAALEDAIAAALADEPSLVAGPRWFQGDHALFAMHGVPALAVTSERVEELVATVVHTPADTVELVDAQQLARLARALHGLIARLPAG